MEAPLHIRATGIIFLGLAAALGVYASLVPQENPSAVLVTVLFAILGFGLLERAERTQAVSERMTQLELRQGQVERVAQDAVASASAAFTAAEEAKKLASRATLAGRG